MIAARPVLVLAALLAAGAGCYSPRFDSCSVRCGAGCPADTMCGGDGFCHAAGESLCPGAADAALDATGDDAAMLDAAVPDAAGLPDGLVECQTSDDCPLDRPVCRPDKRCWFCNDDAQCEARADVAGIGVCGGAGTCLSADQVIMVDRSAPCSGADGSLDHPYCEIQPAVDAYIPPRTIVARPGDYSPLLIEKGVRDSLWVNLHGKRRPTGELGARIVGAPEHGILVHESILSLVGLAVLDSTMDGIHCEQDADCFVDRSALVGNQGYGVYISAAGTSRTVDLQRSVLAKNGAGAVLVIGADPLGIRNNFIYGNAPGCTTCAAITLQGIDAGFGVIDFDTFYANGGPAMSCENLHSLSSSIIVGNGGGVVSGPCSLTYCLTDEAVFGSQPTNVHGDPKFVDDDPSAPDLHLMLGSDAIDNAAPGRPPFEDIDGDAREEMLDIGADEYLGDTGTPCLGPTCGWGP